MKWLAFFIFNWAQAFVLIDHDYRLSKPTNTKIYIASGTCSFDNDQLVSAIKDSVNRYWNDVAESRLSMKYAGEISFNLNSTAESGTVVVGCAPLSGAAGVTIPSTSAGSSVIALDSNSFVTGGFLYEGLVNVLAHELGHAVGLGHSNDSASVMTYNSHGWYPSPTYLSQDDKDGVAYLYPYEDELAGTLGGCAPSANAAQGPVPGGGILFWLYFILPFVFWGMLRFYRG